MRQDAGQTPDGQEITVVAGNNRFERRDGCGSCGDEEDRRKSSPAGR
ncbi:MAG: hypothetical protein R3224_06460 [Balneolaceae bacterium]|nr:hypothetical protein [Balneolaceae bacterium]